MRVKFAVVIFGLSLFGMLHASPTISIDSAEQVAPWNGKIRIVYTVQGVDDFWVDGSISMKAIDGQTESEYACSSFSEPLAVSNGTREVIWNSTLDRCPADTTNYYFRATINGYPKYIVFDLSDGPTAETFSRSVRYSEPQGGWNNEYKTNSMVFRACPASSSAGVASPFYIGVFELTKGQYYNVMGADEPAITGWETGRATRDEIPNKWTHPISQCTHSDMENVLSAINSKVTGVSLCMPSVAQWQYASLGGCESVDINSKMGRFKDSLNDGAGDGVGGRHGVLEEGWYVTMYGDAVVGSYAPNGWGIYDMYGNVWEWTSEYQYDWYGWGIWTMKGGGWMDRINGNTININVSISFTDGFRADSTSSDVRHDSFSAVSNLESNYFTGFGGRFVFDASTSVSESISATSPYLEMSREIENINISPIGCEFSDTSITVSISCETPNVDIYYTLDGSVPSKENGHRYTAPITLFKTTTVKAIAVRTDWIDSAIIESSYTREDSIGEAANLLQYPMENDETYPWTVDTEISHDGISAIKSGGKAVKNVISVVATSVKRAGTVRFWWKADCEESEDGDFYDYLAFIVDDEVVDKLAGQDTAWKKVTYEIPTGGKHVLRWEYRKDGATSRYSDCGWVDQIEWIPADDSGHTVTTIKPVPYSWLQKFNLGTDTDFETAANGASGKAQSGVATSVFDEFWIGTDPTNHNSKLTATIDMTNGSPIIHWIPDLSTNDMVRSYKIWGKATLDGEEEWACPTNSTHHFFKVSIDIP